MGKKFKQLLHAIATNTADVEIRLDTVSTANGSEVHCRDMGLQTLHIPHGVTVVHCENNNLTNLILPASVDTCNCTGNPNLLTVVHTNNMCHLDKDLNTTAIELLDVSRVKMFLKMFKDNLLMKTTDKAQHEEACIMLQPMEECFYIQYGDVGLYRKESLVSFVTVFWAEEFLKQVDTYVKETPTPTSKVTSLLNMNVRFTETNHRRLLNIKD